MNPEAQDIRDIKGLVEIPDPPNYWLWAIAILVLIALAFLIWKLLTRKKIGPQASAASIAMAQLKNAENLVEEETAQPLVVATTDAIRSYIEPRFSISATRQTTEEFLHGLAAQPDGEISKYREELEKFLRSCDAVKYGCHDLEQENRRNILNTARQFVEATRNPQPVAA